MTNATRLRKILCSALFVAALLSFAVSPARAASPFRVLAFYTDHTEQDHVDFAHQALTFFAAQAAAEHFKFESTTDWQVSADKLAQYQVVLWLDDEPHTSQQRAAFEQYMEHGGGWIGFHASAYNDAETKWPWFVQFLGGAVFYNNNWPPLPAKLVVEDHASSATAGLGKAYAAPANEWYGWKPNPRDNKDVRVLLSLDPANYPLGLKDVLLSGDIPVVWTNTRYRMLYINMGHGAHIFDSETQNRFFRQALRSVANNSLGQHPATVR